MDFIITEKKATICLNMIVKNECHIIESTLEKLCKKISFDYWVICDTGSTDNTPTIITDFFEKKGIKGELFYDEWTNFAHNRTLALERAYKKTDLLLVFDADDEIVGNIEIPSKVLFDEYHYKFGSSFGTSYTRVLMINNHKKFQFLSVIHEFISCKEGPTKSLVIEGDYYVVSGRSGSRNLDPDKYLKDALILEKAHAEALKTNDQLFHRYAFYCANSYKDCGRFDDAIKWYNITLNQQNQWPQEKYVSCLYMYDCYEKLNEKEKGFFYLVKAFAYDNERVECMYPLLVHYCCENMYKVAYNYYLNVKDFFENKYLHTNNTSKLFTIQDKYNFFVPYYMILIADKVQDFVCVIKMYEIIFTKKQRLFEEWYVKNLLYNLQFFLQYVPKANTNFIKLANNYFSFLYENGVNLQNLDFLNNPEYKNSGILLDNYIMKEITNKPQKFSKEICKDSKNILIYTGFSDIEWNHTYMEDNALGGSEKAVAYLSKCFPKDYNIYISGHVKNEIIDNIQYIHLNELTNLVNSTPIHTLIVSRYISFYEMFKDCSFYQSFIWAHDVLLLPYGCSLNTSQILSKWDKYINKCICLTEWQRNSFVEKYPTLKDKITLINNGIDNKSFNVIDTNKKIKNKFIYSSRPDRGLNILLQLWPLILEKMPDATLVVSSYGTFPSNTQESILKHIIDANDSIKFLGKLNTDQLYTEMASSEYWLYPTHWPETSCITALEMLMSEVICLYYPVAGLTYTMDKCGIQVKPNSEIDILVSLTDEQKETLRKNGREYAEQCSWENRSKIWNNTLYTPLHI
jgi:glycosyltransferase involved in cell wall biosynthesis